MGYKEISFFSLTIVLNSESCLNEIPQYGSLKEQKFNSLWFWRLEVGNQAVGKVGSFWRAMRLHSDCS